MDSDNITNSGKDDNKNGKSDKDANDGNEQENGHSYQVPISQEIINLLLIGNKQKKPFLFQNMQLIIDLFSVILQA